MLQTLANMEKHPESVPINLLIKVPGTPLEGSKTPIPSISSAPSPWPAS